MTSQHELIEQLRSAVAGLARQQRMETIRAAEVAYSHMTLLASLERLGTASATELAQAEGVAKPVIARLLANLVERGYVTREASPADARQAVIELSDLGRAALAKSRRAINDWYTARLDRLSPKDYRALESALHVLTTLATDNMEPVPAV